MLKTKHLMVQLLGLPILAICTQLNAEPVVSSAQAPSLDNGAVITLKGSGFSNVDGNAAPILFDFTSEAYENGVLNTHQSQFKDGQAVLRPNEDPDTLWEKSSNNALVVSSLPARTALSTAHYLMPGEVSFLGWPTAYGGFDTPVDNHKLYVAWYLKMKYDPRYYWAVSTESLSGSFIPGEPVIVNGINGTFIGVGTRGNGRDMLEFELPDQINANNLIGYQIKGLVSGSTVTFPLTFAAGTGTGYETPGSNKYLRIWEDPNGKDGIRISWTQMQLDSYWYYAPVTPAKWHLMEIMLDTDKGQLSAYVDRSFLATVNIKTTAFSGKWSPTIALLGFDGKIQEFQQTEIDDIYMDNKFARVVLGNKPKFADLQSYELQLPEKWSDGYIQFKLNYGSIDPKGIAYIYVISQDGSVNSEGFPLCSDCNAPPSSVPLNIQ